MLCPSVIEGEYEPQYSQTTIHTVGNYIHLINKYVVGFALISVWFGLGF